MRCPADIIGDQALPIRRKSHQDPGQVEEFLPAGGIPSTRGAISLLSRIVSIKI
jgi:hypothetical protein